MEAVGRAPALRAEGRLGRARFELQRWAACDGVTDLLAQLEAELASADRSPEALLEAATEARRAGRAAEEQKLFDRAALALERRAESSAAVLADVPAPAEDGRWSANGELLIHRDREAAYLPRVIVRDGESGRALLQIPGHDAALIEEGRTLAVALGGAVSLYDLETGLARGDRIELGDDVSALHGLKNSRALLAHIGGGRLAMLDVVTREVLWSARARGPHHVALSSDGTRVGLLHKTPSYSVELLDARTGQAIASREVEYSTPLGRWHVRRFVLSPDGAHFAVSVAFGRGEGETLVMTAAGGRPRVLAADGEVTFLDRDRLRIGRSVWAWRTGASTAESLVCAGPVHPSEPKQLCGNRIVDWVRPDSAGIALGTPAPTGWSLSRDGQRLRVDGAVLDIATGRVLSRASIEDEHAVLSPDGEWIIAGRGDELSWIRVETAEVVRTAAIAEQPVRSEIVSSDVSLAVQGDPTSPPGPRSEPPLPASAGPKLMSPDGNRLFVATARGVRSWNARTGDEVPSISHLGDLDTLAISGDGRWLAASRPSETFVWDLLERKLVRRLPGRGIARVRDHRLYWGAKEQLEVGEVTRVVVTDLLRPDLSRQTGMFGELVAVLPDGSVALAAERSLRLADPRLDRMGPATWFDGTATDLQVGESGTIALQAHRLSLFAADMAPHPERLPPSRGASIHRVGPDRALVAIFGDGEYWAIDTAARQHLACKIGHRVYELSLCDALRRDAPRPLDGRRQ